MKRFSSYARRAPAAASMLLALSVAAQEKITYQDHVLPLIEQHCSKCHNADKKKADLELTAYATVLKGGGSGASVVSGNPDASKLWKSIAHTEEPFMPPSRPKLSDKELEVFKKWIAGGLLENAAGKAVAATKPAVDLSFKADATGKPEGPPPMPQDWPAEPVVHAPRGSAITGLASSPWAPLVAVAGQKQILIYHSDTLLPLGIVPFPEGQPVNVQFSRSGKLLLAAGGHAAKSGRVILYDVVTGDRLATLGDEYDTILAADIRSDQSLVAMGGPSRLIKIVATQNGEVRHKIKKHTDWVTAIAFSPNSEFLATADRNGAVIVWDPDTAQELFTFSGHKSAITALSWRADSKLVASASEDGTVKTWEMQEGKQAQSWTAHGSGTLDVHCARDGRFVTCGRDQTVTLWKADGGKIRSFEFFGETPLRATLSHDGKRVFASDFSGRVAAWNAEDGKRLGELDANPKPLAEQLKVAEKQLADTEPVAADLAKKAAAAAAAAADARAAVARLKTAQLASSAYQVRTGLNSRKSEFDQATTRLKTSTETLQRLEKELAASRAATTNTEQQIKTAKAETVQVQPVVARLTTEIESAQARLKQLTNDLQRLKAGK